MKTEKSTISDTWFTWSSSRKAAVAKVAARSGIPKSRLKAKHTGLTRPGGYSFSGDVSDGITEEVGASFQRYAVKVIR